MMGNHLMFVVLVSLVVSENLACQIIIIIINYRGKEI